jgi:large subunit ribosomal protein L29
MAILRNKEIRAMPSEDRRKKVAELQTELVRLKTMIKAGGSIENPSRIRELHKTIARLLTIENEPKVVKEKKK